MKNIRQATTDDFYFNEIQVANLVDMYRENIITKEEYNFCKV